MDKIKEKIGAVYVKYYLELDNKNIRRNFSYDLKTMLEKDDVDFTAINVYTPPEIVDAGKVWVEIDNVKYVIPDDVKDTKAYKLVFDI